MATEVVTITPPSHALEINPESVLEFILTRPDATGSPDAASPDGDGIPRCVMTLKHPATTSEHLAFKVKTTQPRRYLVRPNQGVIAPGESETIAIILVDKEKQILIQSYDRLGQSALDHSKDKFLVQSCIVPKEFALQFSEKQIPSEPGAASKTSRELTDAMTSMWNEVSSGDINKLYNKKLHVKHIINESIGKIESPSSDTSLSPPSDAPDVQSPLQKMERLPMESMSHEQVLSEVSSLRRKYDELVSFSVNLTAERDILNNTLEQTKRDLSREMAARAALESGRKEMKLQQRQKNHQDDFFMSILQIIIVGLACLFVGIKAGKDGSAAAILGNIPIISNILDL